MKENAEEKSLIKINENSVFYKIKQFFKKIFHNNKIKENVAILKIQNSIIQDDSKRNKFTEEIKNIEDEETLLLNLQKRFRSGEIKEEELSNEQVNALCALYDKQIANLKKSNEIRKQKLLEYRRKMQTDN